MKIVFLSRSSLTIQSYVREFSLFVIGIISFTLSVRAQQSQTIMVKGVIRNDSARAIANASVIIKGTRQGTSSNDNGEFELTAPANGTLIVSSVGYTTREVRINGKKSITVVLARIVNTLDQVVVVGYGTQRKRDVTGAVVSVNEQALREIPAANIQSALQGRAAGLELQNTSTTPGGGYQIRVRGVRSINGSNSALIVLDGIPYVGNLTDINPDDVASVDVLKDASATAIYGSRGANGVILITTKKGRNGEARVSYNGYYGLGNPSFTYPVFNVPEYESMRAVSTWTQGYMPIELLGIQNGTSTNWQDLLYKTATKTDNNITVSGGNNNSTYSLGGGYYRETALLPGQDFTRYSVRATIDTKVGKRIRLGLNTLNNVNVVHGSQFVKYGTMFPLISLSPLAAPDTNGVMVLSPAGNPTDIQQYNPLLLKNNNNAWVDVVRKLQTFNSLYGEYEFIPGLKYRINLGLYFNQEEDDQFRMADSKGTNVSDPHAYFANNNRYANEASVNNASGYDYTVENLLTYDKTFGKSRINFTGLYSFEKNSSHNTFVTRDSIDQNFIEFYNLGQSSTTYNFSASGNESTSALISYMARANYAYDNRYLLTVTYRDDGSSRLAAGHKWHSYPAVSAGWNITNEKFWRDNKVLSNLKLRAGFGQTSNQSINPYASLGQVSNQNFLSNATRGGLGSYITYNWGPTIARGYNLINLPNPSLDWEYTKTINIGLDYGFINNRITGAIDYYHQRTDKILYQVTLPASSGIAGQYTTNVGQMQNWGMEFSVSSLNIHTSGGFTWTTDLNLFFNRNKILKLNGTTTQDIANQLFVGYSISSIYDYKKLGIWQQSEAAEAAKYNSVPGQLKLEDHNNDGQITSDDRYVIGNADAKLQGGMTNRFAYKGVDLSFVVYARFGGLLISQIHQPTSLYVTQMNGDRNQIAVNYWTPTNPSNWFPYPGNTLSPVTAAMSSLGYYDATFVKIRSINLGYSFSPQLLKGIHAQTIRIYGTIDNVATLFSPYKKLTGIDPEGTGTGDQSVSPLGNIRTGAGDNNPITIGLSAPTPRYFILGVNLTF
ncbi:MAG TPA: TonB-dependent receptor [Chitinophagaceae bacterium]|nr:TonB-dependent receptor [Chitinophagaceae bacterium]